MIVSLHPQHFDLPRSSRREIERNSCSWPGANSFPRLCSTSRRRDRAKGSRQKYLYCGSRVAVWLSSCLLPVARTFRPSCLPPRTILPSPPKEVGRQDVRRQDRCSAGPGKHTADIAEGHSLLLLLHILAQIPCPEQWATKRNASEAQTKNLLLSAGLKKGRCVVVWLVLIHILKLYASYSMVGARQTLCPIKKKIWSLDTWGPRVTWASPPQGQKTKNNSPVRRSPA